MNNLKNKAFTLIEIIVSITIFMIVIISITAIFIISSDISKKAEINRNMQENIKSSVETITEDIRKNWISAISQDIWIYKSISDVSNNSYSYWTSLKVLNNSYYLSEIWWNRISNPVECEYINRHCYIYRKSTSFWSWPLTNSLVSVKRLEFYVSNDGTPKVTINITMQPSVKKWIKTNLIKESKIIFQTTVSEKPF